MIWHADVSGRADVSVLCAGARQQNAVGADGGRRCDGAQRMAAARICAAHGVPLRAGADCFLQPLLQGCGKAPIVSVDYASA